MAQWPEDAYGPYPMALEPSQQPSAALDRAALLRLCDTHLPDVYAYVGSRIDDRQSAEQITAATFHRAVEAAREEGFDGPTFVSFVFRVAATAVVDHARRARGTYPRGVRAADFDRVTDPRRTAQVSTDDNAGRAFIAAINRRSLRRSIQDLPDARRRVILLRYLDGLTDDQQCAVLGWSRETLARRVHAALASIHATLAQESTDAA